MIRLRLSELAAALGCPPPAKDVAVHAIVTDSRRADFGALFAALPGSQVDGHDFAPAAVRLGAVALLVNRPLDLEVQQLVVDDVLAALGRLAAMLRERLDPVVVGITGSNGKTTVKEMVASILRPSGPLLATRGNYNNELGVPLTLFELEPRHRFAVLELGASKAGDIAYLAGIARPDIALVTNIGPAHLGGFGTLEGVARAKGEIYAALPADGCAIVNADEPWAEQWKQVSGAKRVLTFGTGADCDVQAGGDDQQTLIRTPRGSFEVHMALPGAHNRINAAAATAVALALDLDLDAIRKGLETVQPVPGRLNFIETTGGWTVIDDTYNANPASLYSALQVLSEMQGTPWLVLGDMKELGTDSHKMHSEVGEAARVMGVRRLFATGEMSLHTVDAFGEGAEHFESREALTESLRRQLRPGINCLVKGSRSMGMETVVAAITHDVDVKEAI
ncbi:MAG TPA: UDP-N-acetylmuramoyl-tripeptide--D-alanyl-D-alanine ligase [Xanthomonadales bacterium]|nr:UDP-N-acetylmuramoyl-tripeptide--D-alanyl-D-alanine ligase [Xanthomonadales bacterium]